MSNPRICKFRFPKLLRFNVKLQKEFLKKLILKYLMRFRALKFKKKS
jgi:hypothetical protein